MTTTARKIEKTYLSYACKVEGLSVAMEIASFECFELDQDWENESTTYHFDDGSAITINSDGLVRVER